VCPPFTEDGNTSPNRWVGKFNDSIRGFVLSEPEKVTLFTRLVRVGDAWWDEGMSPHRNTLNEYQSRFLQIYWSKTRQETILRDFEETKFKWENLGDLIKALDTWYHRLSALTAFSHLTRSDVINKLIGKLPTHKQDLLRLGDNHDFEDFKARVTRVIHVKDLRNKEGSGAPGRQQGGNDRQTDARSNPRPPGRNAADGYRNPYDNPYFRAGNRGYGGHENPRVNAQEVSEVRADNSTNRRLYDPDEGSVHAETMSAPARESPLSSHDPGN
jgi:hypothetical protein